MRKSLAIILTIAFIGASAAYANHTQTKSASSPATGSTASSQSPGASQGYRDGTYTGDSADTPYGPVQIAIIVSGGKITSINFLQMPDSEGHSREVTIGSEPILKQETLQKQTAHIDFVTGATSTSQGYQQSLQAALDQAA